MFKRSLQLVALTLGLLAPGLALAATPERFTVEVHGKGPDVILIPGLASSRAVWDGTVRQLEGTHRVHVLQVRGFAGLPAGPNAEGPIVEPLVEDIDAYIKAQHLKRPAVIGHSLGGFSALLLAKAHPDDVGRVMIVDALPWFGVLMGGPTATVQSLQPKAEAFRKQIETQSDEEFRKSQTGAIANLVKGEADRATVLEWSMTTDRKVLAQAAYDVITNDQRGQLAGIKTPVTVVYAKDPSMGMVGPYIDPLYKDAYASLPSKTLVRVDGSLHFIMLDQPKAFADQVDAFLK